MIVLVQLAASLYMVGVIWFSQIVHYSLFANVGNQEFPSYEKRHRAMIKWVVAPPMLLEGATAVLQIWFRPTGVPNWCLWIGLTLLVVIWLSTWLIQVPCHKTLSQGYNPIVHQRLVLTNWLRTTMWSLRGLLMLAMLWACLSIETSPSKPRGSINIESFKIGDRAPDFSATTQDGNRISLSDYVGKRGLVLFFYPKDGTSICTQEACAFRDSYEKFLEAGVDVIGVSGDTEKSHRDFIRQHKLSFPLISDADESLRKTFAVQKTMGILPGRVTYVIDKDGIIRQIFSAQFASDEHVQKALSAVKGLNTKDSIGKQRSASDDETTSKIDQQ
jgi:peroxiredoxin Q/BCP